MAPCKPVPHKHAHLLLPVRDEGDRHDDQRGGRKEHARSGTCRQRELQCGYAAIRSTTQQLVALVGMKDLLAEEGRLEGVL
jgi:hypothetical protein